MSEVKKHKIFLEIGLVAILFFGIFHMTERLGMLDNLKPTDGQGKVIMIIGIIVMVHLVIMVHELGHVVAGLVQGFRFELFVVGLLGVKRDEDKVRVYLNKNMGYYGGVASTLPVERSPDNLKKFANMVLAGPIASLLFAVGCLVASQFVGAPYGLLLYTGGVTSIGIFLATTVPSKTGMFFTDRKRYQRLMTPGHTQETELAMLNIISHFTKDGSYKNVSREDVELLITDDVPSMKYYGLFNMICWQLEHHGNVEEGTQEHYETLSQTMNKSIVSVFDKEIKNYSDKLDVKS